MAHDETIDPQDLVNRAGGLRRLAQGLLLEPDRDEDVVQEACLVALRKAPVGDAMAWLRGAVRRLALGENRSSVRRKQRERAAALPERQASAVEELGRIEILKSLIAALEALDEPYREAIVLRFFHALTPR